MLLLFRCGLNDAKYTLLSLIVLSLIVFDMSRLLSLTELLSRTDSIELGPEGELGLELVLAELRLWYFRDLRTGGDRILLANPLLAFVGVGENLTCFGGDIDFDRCIWEIVGLGL